MLTDSIGFRTEFKTGPAQPSNKIPKLISSLKNLKIKNPKTTHFISHKSKRDISPRIHCWYLPKHSPFFIVLSQTQNKFYTKLQKTKNLTHAHRFHKHHHAHHTINPKKKETEERDWRGARIFYAWLVSVKVRMRSFSRLLHGVLFFCGSAYWANTVSGAYGFVVLDRLAFQLWCICLLSSFVAGLEVW